MSKLAEFRAAERALAKQVTAFEELKNDAELKREIEFDEALAGVLKKFGMSRPKLLAFLQMELEPESVKTKAGKSGRKVPDFHPKIFTNPHTNESITVKLRTHGTYKEWVGKYGKDVVESWIQPE